MKIYTKKITRLITLLLLGFSLFVDDLVDLAKGTSTNFFLNNVLFEDLLAYVGGNANLQAYYFYFSW